jgi:seryl-tRNA synthetase
MNKDIMAECAQLSQFDEELYKVTGGWAGGLFGRCRPLPLPCWMSAALVPPEVLSP